MERARAVNWSYRLLADTWRRRLGYAVAAAILAILCLFPQPFVGRTKLVPQDPGSLLNTGNGRLQDIAAIFGGGRRGIDLYLTIGQSADVRDDVIRDLRLVGSGKNYTTLQQAQRRLVKRVDVQSLPGGIIEIKVKTHDADESLRLTRGYAAALANRLRALNHDQLQTKQALIASRSREAVTRLASAEGKLAEFRRRNGLSPSPESQLSAAITVRTGLEAELQGRLVELGALQQFLGPENPRLRTLQSQIAGLRSRIAQSVKPDDSAGGPNMGGLTELSNEYFNLYRDYIFAQSIYQVYMRLSEEFAVEELSGKTAETVQIIEAAHLDAWRHYNMSAVAALTLLGLLFLFTEFYAPATGIRLWRRKDLSEP